MVYCQRFWILTQTFHNFLFPIAIQGLSRKKKIYTVRFALILYSKWVLLSLIDKMDSSICSNVMKIPQRDSPMKQANQYVNSQGNRHKELFGKDFKDTGWYLKGRLINNPHFSLALYPLSVIDLKRWRVFQTANKNFIKLTRERFREIFILSIYLFLIGCQLL